MSNSPLVTYTRISPNHNNGRTYKGKTYAIDRISIHCVVGQCTVERLGDIFAPTSRQASCNYGVAKDGKIGMYVEEKDRSWCTSSAANDYRAVTIETASDATHPYAVTDAAFSALLDLCTDICQRNGKKKLLWFGDKDKTLAYTPAPDEMVLTVHRWFANKACPGQYLYDRHPQIAEEVTRRLNAAKEQEDEAMTKDQFKQLWLEMRKDLQDNDAGQWSAEARQWAVDNGIVVGSSSSEFNGMWEDVLTREQMAVMLFRFAKLLGKA